MPSRSSGVWLPRLFGAMTNMGGCGIGAFAMFNAMNG
jgi:hypothetical protein